MKRSSAISLIYFCLVVIGFALFDHTVFSLVYKSQNNMKYDVNLVGSTLLGPRTAINKLTYNDITQPPCVYPYLNDKLPATGQAAKRLLGKRITPFATGEVFYFHPLQRSNRNQQV